MYKRVKVGEEKPNFYFYEVCQHWINPQGKNTVVSYVRHGMFSYNSWGGWQWGTLEIRSDYSKYYEHGKIYPKKKVQKTIRRNGFKRNFHNLHPSWLFQLILKYPKAETLLKSKQYKLFYLYDSFQTKIEEKYWHAIKIAIRNGYIITNPRTFFDYMDDLDFFNMDTHNPKYICNENMEKHHQQLSARRRKIMEKQWEEERKQRDLKRSKEYIEMKQQYFGLCFGDHQYTITVLKSIEDFHEEGEALHHCVSGSGYYTNKDYLIMSARFKGERVETVQISLKSLDILQARGLQNRATEHHDRILKLVREHMILIKQVRDYGEVKPKTLKRLQNKFMAA